jgi:hypothetical protein
MQVDVLVGGRACRFKNNFFSPIEIFFAKIVLYKIFVVGKSLFIT